MKSSICLWVQKARFNRANLRDLPRRLGLESRVLPPSSLQARGYTRLLEATSSILVVVLGSRTMCLTTPFMAPLLPQLQRIMLDLSALTALATPNRHLSHPQQHSLVQVTSGK